MSKTTFTVTRTGIRSGTRWAVIEGDGGIRFYPGNGTTPSKKDKSLEVTKRVLSVIKGSKHKTVFYSSSPENAEAAELATFRETVTADLSITSDNTTNRITLTIIGKPADVEDYINNTMENYHPAGYGTMVRTREVLGDGSTKAVVTRMRSCD